MSSDSIIGNYEIIEKIGMGGMASVYRAYQPKLDRHVAIKVMHQTIAADENFLARFEREARIVARLDHPNIVPIYDYDEVDGQPFLVMKFVEGQTLKQLLRQGPMQPTEVVRIIAAVADALQYAHESGILHRDIKPSNILIDGRGNAYLTDFGLARVARSGESTMSADVMLGTPHYISPEQAQGNTDLDPRTDVYSLGVVLYELTTGRVPFVGDTSYAIINSQINTPPPPPHTINPDVPDEVEAVLMKALAKDRNKRYDSVKAMADAYRDAVAGTRVSAPISQIAPREQTPPPSSVREQIEGNFFDRFVKGVETWGRHMEAQFSDFEEEAKYMDEDEKKQEAKRRFQEAWRATREGGSHATRRESRSERRAERREEREKRKHGLSVVIDTDDDDDDEVQYDPNLTPEENLRRRIEARMNERVDELKGWAIHLFFFVLITSVACNLQGMVAQLAQGTISTDLNHLFIYLWGFGLFVHTFETFGKYGPGYNRRQRKIDEEVQRQMMQYSAMLQGQSLSKRKNDRIANPDDDRPVRLTGDGEFTQSFIDEMEDDARYDRS